MTMRNMPTRQNAKSTAMNRFNTIMAQRNTKNMANAQAQQVMGAQQRPKAASKQKQTLPSLNPLQQRLQQRRKGMAKGGMTKKKGK